MLCMHGNDAECTLHSLLPIRLEVMCIQKVIFVLTAQLLLGFACLSQDPSAPPPKVVWIRP